jgi:PKD repeat protein
VIFLCIEKIRKENNMKKMYTLLAALGLFSAANAQQAFWDVVNYKGAFPVTDNTSATDWTAGWSNFDPENTPYGATTTTVSSDITTNTTWSGIVLLQNKVYVKNNATLTIQPGTIIRGDKLTQGTLIITRGARINANGTATQPIVFTSNESVGNRAEGDWGGLVILGLARNNQPAGVANIEGIAPTTDTQHGGNFDTDNSGTLRYVRVEFAGIPLEPNKEINGITFGSVGSATTVDYLQVSFSGDDAYEWFGGTVNCKHLIAYRTLDDDFDTDFGYRGKVQFGLIIRDKDLSDAAGDSNAFESDNDATGSAAQPKTMPIFSNITIVGPKGNGSISLPVGEKFEKAFRLRRNTSTSVFNSLVTGWEKGLSVEGTAAEANVNGDSLVFSHNVLSNFTLNTNCVTATPAFYSTFFGADANDSTMTIAQIDWVNIFTPLGTTPDARLNGSSSAASGADFSHVKFYNLAAPTASNTVTYCQGETAAALSATPGTGNSLYWYTQANGGVASTSAPVPSTAAAATYYYYVSQYNTAGDESPRTMITVQVNPTPATPTITANGPTSFCTGGSVTLTSNQTSGNVWSNGSVGNSITVTASGTFTVTYTDNNGCSATSTATIVDVSNAPVPTINASATEACTGETVTLTASTGDSYAWSTGATTQSITITATETVTVTTTNANACNGVGTSAPITVTFTQTPTAAGSFTTSGNVVTFTNTSTGATDYSWDFGDFTNSSAAAPLHAYAANGSYTVVLTAINGTCADEYTMTVSISVSLEELSGLSEVTLFPNPTNAGTTISFNSQSAQEANVKMINALGQIVSDNVFNTEAGFNQIALGTTELNNGLYNVMIETENGMVIRKLIVQK